MTPPDNAAPVAPDTELAVLTVPEVVDFEVIRTSIGPSIDKLIARADKTVARLAAGIKDDETMALAVREAEGLRDNGQDFLNKYREKLYMDVWYRPGEEVREVFDGRLKPIAAHIKTLMAHISDYKTRKKREANIARERAEAEARQQQDEAAAKQRAAEEAERRAKQAAEDEKRRKEEAIAAEARRVQAEKEAQERRDREAREAAALETKRKLDEEERARIAHAEAARDEGNGAAKVDTILDSATPISPVLGKAEQAPDLKSVRLEQENAKRVADEKSRRDKEESEAAEKKRKEAEAEAFRLRQEADLATAAATASAAAAAATEVAKVESGTTGTIRWVWDLNSDGTEEGDIKAMMFILREILEGRKPIEYIGYNPKRPKDFRPSIIGDEVTEKKDRFSCPGIRAFPQNDERLRRRTAIVRR